MINRAKEPRSMHKTPRYHEFWSSIRIHGLRAHVPRRNYFKRRAGILAAGLAALMLILMPAAAFPQATLVDTGSPTNPPAGTSLFASASAVQPAGSAPQNGAASDDCCSADALKKQAAAAPNPPVVECHKSVIVFGSNRCKSNQNQSRRSLRKRLTRHNIIRNFQHQSKQHSEL